MMKGRKKGQLMALQNVVLGIVVIGFLIAIGITLLIKVKDTNTSSAALNTSVDTLVAAIDDIPDWMPIIVLAFVALIVLSVVYMFQRGSVAQ